jgi:cytochrome b involved in lipid metabolism
MSDIRLIIIIDNYRFDVTDYAKDHPGGINIFKKYNGKDVTKYFNEVKGHCDAYVYNKLEELCIGEC